MWGEGDRVVWGEGEGEGGRNSERTRKRLKLQSSNIGAVQTRGIPSAGKIQTVVSKYSVPSTGMYKDPMTEGSQCR